MRETLRLKGRMRLATLFAVYIASTIAAIYTPWAIHKIDMTRREMIPVNSEAPLEPAPARRAAPTGQFTSIPLCASRDGIEYFKDYHFDVGSEINDRRTFVDNVAVRYCSVGGNGTVYLLGSSEGQNWLRAYDSAAQMKWSVATDENRSPLALAHDGTVYFISMPRTGNTTLHAFDSDGRPRWKFETSGFLWDPVPPAIGPDGTLYVYSGIKDAPAIVAVSRSGEKLWSTPLPAPASEVMVAPDGTVVVNVPAGHVIALNPQGSQIWSYYASAVRYHGGMVIGSDGTVYFGAGFLYALYQGVEKWNFKSELTYTRNDYFDGDPVIAEDGTIYADSYYHQLYAVTPNGRKKWAVSYQPPSLPGLALSTNGTLRTQHSWFQVSSGLAAHGWPSTNADASNSRSQEAK